jgi:Questin oxidase-like
MLARWWPRLLPGLAASATHGVIRTAHAVRSLVDAGNNPDRLLLDELARGLAFWAARYQTLPGAPSLRGKSDAVAAVANLPRLDPDLDSPEPGIIGRLRLLPLLPSFSLALDSWKMPSNPHQALSELISASARVVAVRGDAPIAYCHTVTGPAAVRMTLNQLPESLWWPSVAATWQVIGGIISAFGGPRLHSESSSAALPEPPTDDTFDDMTERHVAHGDEHVIKLAEAAIREYRISEDQTLLVAAQRFRSRVPPNS